MFSKKLPSDFSNAILYQRNANHQLSQAQLRQYALCLYSQLFELNHFNPVSKQDLQNTVAEVFRSADYDSFERRTVSDLLWKMFFNFHHWEAEIDKTARMLSQPYRECDAIDPFDPLPPDRKKSNKPVDKDLYVFKEDRPQELIDSMLQLGRFLYQRHFGLPTRDFALNFVHRLLHNKALRRIVYNEVPQKWHRELWRLFSSCRKLAKTA